MQDFIGWFERLLNNREEVLLNFTRAQKQHMLRAHQDSFFCMFVIFLLKFTNNFKEILDTIFLCSNF